MFSDAYKTKVQRQLRQWDLPPFAAILTSDLISQTSFKARPLSFESFHLAGAFAVHHAGAALPHRS